MRALSVRWQSRLGSWSLLCARDQGERWDHHDDDSRIERVDDAVGNKGRSFSLGGIYWCVQRSTYALLKQPPRAPARAYPKGVSCCGACFDCTAMGSGEWGMTSRESEHKYMLALQVRVRIVNSHMSVDQTGLSISESRPTPQHASRPSSNPAFIHSFSSTFINNNTSNPSSPFLSCVPRAPTPSNNPPSSSGTIQENDSALRRATNKNTSPSPPPPPASKRSHLQSFSERPRARTGANVNQSPNADQNGVSLDSDRILYERTTCGDATCKVALGAVRCSNERSSGANNSGKYT